MALENVIIVPPFYDGTSFSEIYQSLRHTVDKHKLPLSFIGQSKPSLPVDNGLFDNADTVKILHKTLGELLSNNSIKRALFIDYFFPGLDMLRYMEEINGTKILKASLLHGGTFVPGDLYYWPWLKKAESLWSFIFDRIYAPSEYLKRLVPDDWRDKVGVFPWGMDHIRWPEKALENCVAQAQVVFPHRLNSDKGIAEFYTIAEQLPNVPFIVTTPQSDIAKAKYKVLDLPNVKLIAGQSDEQHLRTLKSSKVVLSCAYQENFGYSIMKSTYLGCLPVLPRRAVYPEFFPETCLYNSTTEAVGLIQSFLNIENASSDISWRAMRKKTQTLSFLSLLTDFLELR